MGHFERITLNSTRKLENNMVSALEFINKTLFFIDKIYCHEDEGRILEITVLCSLTGPLRMCDLAGLCDADVKRNMSRDM